jgi:hypothetical protein
MDWFLQPCLKTLPQRQAVLWFWAHMVVYQVNQCMTLSVMEYIDFMRRAQ